MKERKNNNMYLLASAYSEGITPGIVVYDFDTQTGEIKYVSEITGIVNPSYLAVSPNERYVYAVNETANGEVSSFAFDKTTGTLKPMNRQFTEGADPCYININRDATRLFTANYSGGNVSVFSLLDDGTIEPLLQNIAFSPESHIHTVVFSPDKQHLLITDLGTDSIYQFSEAHTDTTEHLYRKEQAIYLENGAGPRHLAFHPNGKFLYCINEIAGTITVMDYSTDFCSVRQTVASDTTSGIGGKGSADIHLTPDGKFLYASNRLKADGIAVFSVNQKTGMLTNTGYQETGSHPRNFTLSPNGKFLLCANRDSNNIQIFEIDTQNGLLRNTGKEIRQYRPVCLKWIGK
ncbi:MAG: lactonase family protein [Cytophagaceae bacterium]|nr:lactonase family protein [Cytophagaceae bacterium]